MNNLVLYAGFVGATSKRKHCKVETHKEAARALMLSDKSYRNDGGRIFIIEVSTYDGPVQRFRAFYTAYYEVNVVEVIEMQSEKNEEKEAETKIDDYVVCWMADEHHMSNVISAANAKEAVKILLEKQDYTPHPNDEFLVSLVGKGEWHMFETVVDVREV